MQSVNGSLTKSVLYSDMDGTLISDKTISRENIDAVRRFITLGGCFSIATGRSEVIAAPFLKDLPINAPAILYNGAAVYDYERQEFLYRALLDFDIVRSFTAAAMEVYPEVCVEIYTGGTIKLLNPDGLMDHYILTENQPHSLTCIDECRQAMKMIFYGDNARLKEVEKRVYQLSGGKGFVSTFSAPFYFEVLPEGVSKGSALKFCMDYMGLERREFAAIGDFYNDVEMIKAASLGASPSNAPEDVKLFADVVVADFRSHAVADLIDRFLIIKQDNN